jgi:uncharacterized protein (DUF1810 family)
MDADPFDLQRFVSAQDAGGTYDRAVAELGAGRKTSHWMWFVFPQIAGLGRSSTARHYAITSLDEARAYLAHPVLGPRLRECHRLAAAAPAHDAEQLLGGIDAVKLQSSATLFALVSDAPSEFTAVLDRYYAGRQDPETVRLTG